MVKTMAFYHYFMLLMAISFFWGISGAKFSNENTYSSIPMSNRIIEMLRERNAELKKSIPPKPITLHKTSSTPYFNFMKDFANRQGIQYAIQQPITLEPPKIPYIQYTAPLEQTNGSQILCRRLRMC